MVYRSIILLLSIIILFEGVIFAQTPQDTAISLKTLNVYETISLRTYKLTTIDSATTKDANNLSELLSNNSPVFVKTYGSGSLASVSFRGTGASHTSVMWNDVVLNSPMNGQVDFSLFPTVFIDDAELFHGASGLINGTGALGGSVLLNNKTSYQKGFAVSAQQSIGSFENYISNANISYSNKSWFLKTQLYYNSNKNNFSYTNVAIKEKPTITQQNAKVEQYGLQQSIFKKLKNSEIGIRLWYFNSDRLLPQNMLATFNNDALAPNEYQMDESFRTMLEWNGFTSKLNYKLTSAYLKDQLTYNDSMSDIYSKSNTEVIDNKLNTSFYFRRNFELKSTIAIRYEQAIADGFKERYNRFNNFWLVGINKQVKRLNLTAFNRFMMVADETQLLSPSLGLLYGLTKKNNFKIKANAAINYNYPTFNDLYWSVGGNKNLKPEKAEMVEIGIQDERKIKKTYLKNEITAFHSHVYDWIIWLPANNSNIWSPTNLREVENKGIELSSNLNTTLRKLFVGINSNYAYTLSTNINGKNDNDQSVNKQLIYVPYHQLNTTVSLSYNEFVLRYNYNYTGKRFISSDNNWYMPPNFISNLSLAKTVSLNKKMKMSASFKVNNLFDQEYQAMAWRAMPGRNYLVTLALQYN